ncbi:MAG: hypothetical protein GY821_13425 [Gammaproteobacteria bacterium]|nr:hypothetical protein [Gammaproteobacteria bacterium]
MLEEKNTVVAALFIAPSATAKQGEFISVDDHDASCDVTCRSSCSGKCGGIC